MSGNFAIKGGGVGRLMANAILNFHFDFLTPSLSVKHYCMVEKCYWKRTYRGRGDRKYGVCIVKTSSDVY